MQNSLRKQIAAKLEEIKIAGLYKTEVDVPESGKVEVSIQVPVDVEPRP